MPPLPAPVDPRPRIILLGPSPTDMIIQPFRHPRRDGIRGHCINEANGCRVSV